MADAWSLPPSPVMSKKELLAAIMYMPPGIEFRDEQSLRKKNK